MVTAVDTSVVLDTLTGSHEEVFLANRALQKANDAGSTILSIVCYSELAYRFLKSGELDRYIADLGMRVSVIDPETAFLAGQFYRDYKRRGGTRTRILPDFLIAAHARLRANRLLTRDTRFFGQSFPGLHAVAPAEL